MNGVSKALCVAVGLSCVAVQSRYAVADEAKAQVTVVSASRLHVGDGSVIENGMVIVRDGRIERVGVGLETPSGATVVSVKDGCITPGLIDANAALESTDMLTPPPGSRSARDVLHDFFCPRHGAEKVPGCCGSTCPRALQHATGEPCTACGFPNARVDLAVGTSAGTSNVEGSAEVIPHTRVIDSVNLFGADFGRLLRGGVTTVFVAPGSAAVIGSRGAIVHTGGPVGDRVLREAGAIKASMGTDPSWRGAGNRMPWRKTLTFHARRPTTRMGVSWVFRKAFYDARRLATGLPITGADAASEPALRELNRVLAGEIPLRIQARQQHDILAACRLADEFGLSFTLEEGTEAHLCLSELKARNVSVVYGPIYVSASGPRAWSREVGRARLHTMKALLDAGIETVLTAHELREEDGLARQAMYAMRYGVAREDVERSVFSGPARLLGLEDQLGTIAAGKRGDIVVWSGEPFAADSRPAVVLIGGRVVFDGRGD